MVLSGWKDVAHYLNSAVRTVQRWEHYGLPISRPTPGGRGQIMAESHEIDHWLRDSTFRHDQRLSRSLNVERARELRAEVQRTRHTLHLKIEALKREVEIVCDSAERLQRGRRAPQKATTSRLLIH